MRIISSLTLCLLPMVVWPTLARAQAWRQYAVPEEAGFSSAILDTTRMTADRIRSGGVFVVYRGHVLAAWGDVTRKLQLHSVRKSLTSALYGIGVNEKRIDLDATLAALQIDDTTRLTRDEKSAKVRDLIAARSGVYLPAAYAPASQEAERPARGAHAPGTSWHYNNWDFNVAETIYQKLSGESVYDAFARRIAGPLGMEDFSPADGFLVYEPSASLHPAHTWRMSARDLSRFGLLYLQKGQWNGRQVIPADWLKQSTAAISDLGSGRGYGYMWWTYAQGSYGARYPTLNRYASFAASGTGGQAIIVIPDAELVIVHRGDTDHNRNVSGGNVWDLVERVLHARQREPKAQPNLVPLSLTPFASQLPPLEPPRVLPVDAAEVAAMVGEYDVGQPDRARVAVFRGRPFAYLPGQGEAELLRVAPWDYTIAVMPDVSIRAERNDTGSVSGLAIRLGNRTLSARRVPLQ